MASIKISYNSGLLLVCVADVCVLEIPMINSDYIIKDNQVGDKQFLTNINNFSWPINIPSIHFILI